MKRAQRALVVIPTYNERENILALVPEVLGRSPLLDVLVVDDASPDGTGKAAEALKRKHPGRVHVLHRQGKLGLGTAYVEGFTWGLAGAWGAFLQMDADWSHDPKYLPQFLEGLKGHGVVLGTRYLGGRVSVVNWPIRRLMLSQGANLYVRLITGLPLSDSTGGYKGFRREVLERIDLKGVRSDGYAFQVEMNYKARKAGASFLELPIIFIDRTSGTSKMSPRVIREAVWRVWAIRLGF